MSLPKHPSLQPNRGWRMCCCQHALEEHKVVRVGFTGDYSPFPRWRRAHSVGVCKIRECVCTVFLEVHGEETPEEMFNLLIEWARHCSL